ncbi:hypothetical protein ACHAWO_005180 [Cyclotella atomus]|uniref:Uncharacterized protein n=1 Tax=Cyclotella atomus TaxID=382360 RepID=A0ABD3NEL0_9STRA
MAGSTSSISSNEGRNTKPAAAVGRGSPPVPASAGGSQSSRMQTPPPPSVGQQSVNNSQPSSPSAASRNALGISHGWGVGLAHSGSYLATSVRTVSNIPMLVEDPDTYDAIKNIMIEKKAREQSQLEMRAKQQVARKKQLPTPEEREKIAEKREAAVLQITQGKEKLQKLLLERDELEKSIRSEWDEKIKKFKKDSLLKEEEAINILKSNHEEEMKQLKQDVEAQNKADDDELAAKLTEMDEEKKRKADGDKTATAPTSDNTTSELNAPSTPKRQKLNEPVEDGEMGDSKEPNDLYDDLFESPVKAALKQEEIEDSDHELFGDSDDEVEKSPGGQKKEELNKINGDLNDLNKIKSQMVWLLKQVITAEAKLKMKQKMQAKADTTS